jgi:hypothetical protein
MKRTHRYCLIVAVGAWLGVTLTTAADDRKKSSNSSGKTPAAVAPGQGFDAFQLLVERNIFNPNRVGRTRSSPEEKPPRVDEISLVGTMESARGRIAFFDSPDAAFRKALREGESVGDFKVQRIATDGVDLVRDDKPLALKVSQQLRRPEGGDWSVRSTPTAAPESRTGPNGSTIARTAEVAAEPEIPADASEVLKRLMKKREKQLK